MQEIDFSTGFARALATHRVGVYDSNQSYNIWGCIGYLDDETKEKIKHIYGKLLKNTSAYQLFEKYLAMLLLHEYNPNIEFNQTNFNTFAQHCSNIGAIGMQEEREFLNRFTNNQEEIEQILSEIIPRGIDRFFDPVNDFLNDVFTYIKPFVQNNWLQILKADALSNAATKANQHEKAISEADLNMDRVGRLANMPIGKELWSR